MDREAQASDHLRRFGALALAAYPETVRLEQGGALWVSLPGRAACPDADLMREQIAFGGPMILLPCGPAYFAEPIAFGDQVPAPPLLGRTFLHGVRDCWALCRDYYRERGLILPVYPRDWGWWKHTDLIGSSALADFRRADHDPLEVGDLLGWSSSPGGWITHTSVCVDGGVLHHTTSRGRYFDPSSLSAIVPFETVPGYMHSKWRPR